MKQVIRIFRTLAAVAAFTLLGACQETMEIPANEGPAFPVPEGEIPFTLCLEEVGNAGTRSEVFGEQVSTLSGEAIQMLCFDEAGYYMGIRQAYIGTSNTPPSAGSSTTVPGTFSGYVPIGTARIHFVANAYLPDPLPFPVGTSEKVVMQSSTLSTGYMDTDGGSSAVRSVKFWGYQQFSTADAMKTWLQTGLTSTPNLVQFLRDRACIKLTIASTVTAEYDISWTVFNGRDQGYLAPYNGSYDGQNGRVNPWAGYESGVPMTEYKESGRYTICSEGTDIAHWDPSSTPQYVFEDSNKKFASGEDGRIRIILKVNPKGNSNNVKYILILLRDAATGEQIQVTRNQTYNINIQNLSHEGYDNFERATKLSSTDFANAPADVENIVPAVSDGSQILELLTPGPITVVRQVNGTVPVSFSFKDVSVSNGNVTYTDTYPTVTASDFVIEWENDNQTGWTIGSAVHSSSNQAWEFNLTIGSVGHTYALDDYLVIRHKKSGLSRAVHVYAVDAFSYRVAPTLTQVFRSGSPYHGPSGDDVKRPVFELSFALPESLGKDMFPLTIRLASSTLEPFGDNSTSFFSRLPGGFGLVNASTSTSWDGISLASSNTSSDWNYQSAKWNYWYEYTLDEYPENGVVKLYFKDTRDSRALSSNQDVGLYLDIKYFSPVGKSVDSDDITYFSFPAGSTTGEYTVGYSASKYRATITGCTAGIYTLSEAVDVNWLSFSPPAVKVTNDGEFSFFFTVDDNPLTQRSVYLVFTNGNEETRVNIIQEGTPGSAGLKVEALSTEVNGYITEVDLKVFSTSTWTLTGSTGCKFSFSSDASSAETTLSGAASDAHGTIVKFFMPGNYSLSDVVRSISATNTDGDSTSETVTQLGAKEVARKMVSFTADTYRSKYSNASSGNPATNAFIEKDHLIRATFNHLYDYNSDGSSSHRFDITKSSNETATLELVIDEQVLKITHIDFYFFYDWFDYSPETASVVIDNDSNSQGSFSNYSSVSYGKKLPWTGEVTNNVRFTFGGNSRPIAFLWFDVTYDKYVWD